jgi:hypothetical protein
MLEEEDEEEENEEYRLFNISASCSALKMVFEFSCH